MVSWLKLNCHTGIKDRYLRPVLPGRLGHQQVAAQWSVRMVVRKKLVLSRESQV